MIQITKKIAHKLHDEYGVKFKDEGISHTYSRNGKKYFLCESRYNLECLQKVIAK